MMKVFTQSYGLFSLSYGALVLSTLCYLGDMIQSKKQYWNIALGLLALSILIFTDGLGMRWSEVGHAPFANLYESLLMLAYVIILEFWIVEYFHPTHSLGALLLPLSILILGYTLNLPPMSYLLKGINFLAGYGAGSEVIPVPGREGSALSPALQSFWFQIHVPIFFLCYGAFSLAFGTAVIYLWKYHRMPVSEPQKEPKLALLRALDYQVYGYVILGFILLNLGVITGAVWAKEAWGIYWSWDPKEVWSLIVWLVYAVYLHLRLLKGWKGQGTAWFAILGFILVMVCYYGVNVIFPILFKQPQGLHSYGVQPPNQLQ